MATKRLSKEDWVRAQFARGKFAQAPNVKAYLAQSTGKWGTPSKSFVAHQVDNLGVPKRSVVANELSRMSHELSRVAQNFSPFKKQSSGARPVVQQSGKKASVGHDQGFKEFDLDSSVLSGGRYDKSTGDMELDFINPSIGTWEYAGVDAQTVRELKNDDSPGGYFNDVIRGVFEA